MINSQDIKNGVCIRMDGRLYFVIEFLHILRLQNYCFFFKYTRFLRFFLHKSEKITNFVP